MVSESHLEIESTLVLCSENPERLAEAIAAKRSIAGLVLREREPLSIVDTYLDLPAKPLGKSGLGIRLRRANGDYLLTFKGPTREVEGARVREELEEAWSGAALDAVCARLRDHGIMVHSARFDANRDPAAALRQLGFSPIQHRELYRRPREVLREPAGQVLAELVVDAVTYRFERRDIRHYEIEVEVKAPGGDVAMRRLVRAIAAEWSEGGDAGEGARVRPWRYGKLATGGAVEALLEAGKLGGLVRDTDCLAPPAYDVIDAWLSFA